MPRLPYALLAVALVATASLAQVTVPGDFATLQAAIDAASPGDVILVDGGDHHTTVIDKPLTIVGTPNRPFLRTPAANEVPANEETQPPAVSLDGPGAGRVTLVNVGVGGQIDGFKFAWGGSGLSLIHI